MWLIMHLERGGHSHGPTGQSVYWQTSVKNQRAHLWWVICVWDHSDGGRADLLTSHSLSEMDFHLILDGDFVREGPVCAWARCCAVSVLFLLLWKRDFTNISWNVMWLMVQLTDLINLSWLFVEVGEKLQCDPYTAEEDLNKIIYLW